MIAALLLAAVLGGMDPTALVDPLIGTGGTSGTGLIDDFPGATAPFGMLQWSPDTPSAPPSGGYLVRDAAITGFSLTHLSGAGCAVFGDFGVLPTVGDIVNPEHAQVPFTHAGEEASPGYYAVSLGNAARVQLAATERVGYGAFTFPATTKANLLIDVASDQAGATDAHFTVVGPSEIVGSASSGAFCGMPNTFTVYFDMQFDRPFAAHGTWNADVLHPGASEIGGPKSGGWVTFDTSQDRTVNVKTAISYVSVAGARANVAAEPAIPDVARARAATARAWRSLLGEVQIGGGTPPEERMFYTALYHALLSPTLFSDADGSYRGFDGRVHRAVPGHAQYTNFSGWDIFRTQLPLMALLAPGRTSDMMESLVHDTQQGGWLPKWPVANGYTGVMEGDSADPIIASAAAFGARDFDRASALLAMLKNARDTGGSLGQGWYQPRPGLDEYLRNGYVGNSHTTSVSPVPNGASETLEYALDDFSIAQFAQSAGREDVYRTFVRRSMNWATIFDTANATVAPRDADGAFVHTPLTSNGQSGFQEGNAAQYTWMVPHATAALVRALGGPAATTARLDTFFSRLDAGQDEPYAWFGNEPTLAAPWVYLYAGAPYRAQGVNRAAMLSLYDATPDGIPGNDDLGTMSAWWVWNAMGLYPFTPGTAVLLVGAPLFTHVSLASPSGRTIVLDAPAASDANAYIRSLRVNGAATNRAWISVANRGTSHLDYVVGPSPNPLFAAAAADAPPSYGPAGVRFPASSTAALAIAAVTYDLSLGTPLPVHFAVTNVAGASPVRVTWSAQAPAGFTLSESHGDVVAQRVSQPVDLTLASTAATAPGLYDVPIRARAQNGAALARVTAIVRVSQAGRALPLAYVANFSDNTLTPLDAQTHAFGNQVGVGKAPGDLTVSRDGSRVYTANQSSNDVSVVDAVAGKTLATVKVGTVPAGIRVTPDGKTLWVSNYGDATVQSIDVATLKASRPIAVGDHPEELAIAPDGSTLYAADQGSNTLSVLDLGSRKIVATVPVGQSPLGVAVAPDGSRVYVSNSVSGDVTVIDARTRTPIARVAVGKTPQGLAVSPDGTLLYVADSGSLTVTPVNLTTDTALPPILVGNGPFSVAFTTDGRSAVVADSADNECVLLDVARGKVVSRIPTASFPIAVGFAHP